MKESIGIALLSLSVLLSAQKPHCTEAQARAAEDGIGHLKTWTDLHSAFKQFQVCDDGAIAEGWSDFTVRMLAKNWGQLTELQRLVARDGQFRQFVIRHIDATAAADDLRAASSNSRERCPRSIARLCAEIATAVMKADEK